MDKPDIAALAENPFAFPLGDPTHGGYDGMTLRDWFAGQALVGMLGSGANHYEWQQTAKIAFCVADAKRAARTALEQSNDPR